MFVWGWQSYVDLDANYLTPKKTVFVRQMTSQPPLTKSIAHLKFAPVSLVMKCKHSLVPCLARYGTLQTRSELPPMTDSYLLDSIKMRFDKTEVG